MTYIAADQSADGVAKIIYQSKDETSTKTFDALDWLAQFVTQIPDKNKGEQMVRYYGFCSDKSRELCKKAGTDDQVPAWIDSDISQQAFRKNWARLIQKVYHMDCFILIVALYFTSFRYVSLRFLNNSIPNPS